MKKERKHTVPTSNYQFRMSEERANKLYIQIIQKLTKEKLYRRTDYHASDLAKELGTNARTISAVMSVCTGDNYNALVNGMRLREVVKMMQMPRYSKATAEELGLLSGFASRQVFYRAFHRAFDCTPREYRLKLREQ